VSELLAPIAVALLLWWLATGVVLFLDGLPRRTYPRSMLGGVVLALAALWGIAASAGDATALGAYAAFACAIAVWGVLEMSYYMDFLTGVHRVPCPPGASPWRRFALALGTSIYHELAVVAAGAVLLLLTLGAPNRVALWTYLVLWLMRWSAKLNLFLGVSNFHQEWLPQHLRYMVTYTARRRMNLLLPVSVAASLTLAAFLLDAALAPHAGAHQQAGYILLAALLALAALEHLFLVVPLADGALWRWALRPESAARRIPAREGEPVDAPQPTLRRAS